MKDFILAVKKANLEILDFIKKTPHEKLCKKMGKGVGGDESRLIDIKAEQIFIKYLKKFGQIYSEEIGFYGKKSDTLIIVDPIDGSSNFISKVPYFGTSVALKKNNQTKCGIVCNLSNKDIFIKTEKNFIQGTLDANNFAKTKKNKLISVGIFEKVYCNSKVAKKFESLNIKYRSLGALALSLAYARNMDFVLFVGKDREFDIAAGMYLCEDLYCKRTKKYLFVSKDKQIFDRIYKKVLKDGVR